LTRQATRLLLGAVVAGLAIAALRLPAPRVGRPGELLDADAARRWEKHIAAVVASVERVVLAVGQRVLSVGAPPLVAAEMAAATAQVSSLFAKTSTVL
jgi:hypothetical protein